MKFITSRFWIRFAYNDDADVDEDDEMHGLRKTKTSL